MKTLLITLMMVAALAQSAFVNSGKINNSNTQADLPRMEEEILQLVNDYLASKGLSALDMDEYMRQLCLEHSQNMANDVLGVCLRESN